MSRPIKLEPVGPTRQSGFIGVRRALYGGKRIAGYSFNASLQTSLVPHFSGGDSTPTYTRSSTAFVTQFDGLLTLVLSSEARFQGSRRIYNEYVGSATLATQGNTVIAGTYAVSFTGTGTITFSGANVGSLVGSGAAVTVGAVITTTAGTLTSTVTGTVTNAMLENQTGRANTAPADVYVDSATAYGANVNGVMYSSSLNASSINATILTRATGAAINSSEAACAGGVTAGVVDASGPLGYLAEGARTNLALQSQTMTHALWSGNGVAATADQYVALDGTTTMDKITASAGSDWHAMFKTHAFSVSAVPTTVSAYLKYVNNRWAALYWTDIGTNRIASFDLLNGVVGATEAGTTSKITPTALAGVYRVEMTFTPTAGVLIAQYYIALHNADSATVLTWNAAGTEIIGAWQLDAVQAGFSSSPIPTTTAAVTRNAEIDQYVSAGNISATALSLTMEISVPTAVALTAGTEYFHWGSYVDADNYTALLSDGTNLIARKRIAASNHDATIAWARAAGTTIHAFMRADTTNGVDVGYDGTLGTPDTTTTASQIGAAFQVGADGNGANQDYCEHRYFVAYQGFMPTSKLTALTT